MKNGKLLAGIDAGHVNTKAVIMRGEEIIGYAEAPTGFDVAAAAEEALESALQNGRVSREEIVGIAATGIFKEMVKTQSVDVIARVPEYMADVKGALFLNKNSRTVIDIGGNVHKAISFDKDGNLIDLIQNDKCADGLGIFYTSMARLLGTDEQALSELALKSTKRVEVAIQCALSAESEAIDLMCQGVEVPDVADAISRFMVERIAAMCTAMPLEKEIVVAGGLAKSQALIKHLEQSIRREVSVVALPEYVCAIGAAVSHGGAK